MAIVRPAAPATPSVKPTSPPSAERRTASRRNCRRMSPLVAPRAIRKPISLVRSVTLTSMMFMIPTPPTNSEIPAIEASIAVITPVTTPSALAISVVFCTWKSLTCPGAIRWRSARRWRISRSVPRIPSTLRAETRIACTPLKPFPTSRLRAVE